MRVIRRRRRVTIRPNQRSHYSSAPMQDPPDVVRTTVNKRLWRRFVKLTPRERTLVLQLAVLLDSLSARAAENANEAPTLGRGRR